MNKELQELVDLLPLDKWQSSSVQKNINRLSEEEAERIAKNLKAALLELPKAVRELSEAIERNKK